MAENDSDLIDKLFNSMLNAVDEVQKGEMVTRGDVMSAAMHIIVHTGLSRPGDSTVKLREEATAALDDCIADYTAGISRRKMN